MFASNCMNYLENGGRTLSRLMFAKSLMAIHILRRTPRARNHDAL
jgi:hypothetical protein